MLTFNPPSETKQQISAKIFNGRNDSDTDQYLCIHKSEFSLFVLYLCTDFRSIKIYQHVMSKVIGCMNN